MEEKNHSPTSESISTIDPWEYLQITLNQNDTLTRRFIPPTSPPSADPSATTTALSKDIQINQQNRTWARLYLPKFALNNPQYYNKLPIVFYYHGGGFVLFNADSEIVHDFCQLLAATAAVMVVSVEYRLAPEHRLPAAYVDATDALACIKDDDDWISRYGDVSSCFLMGSSAGGNIAYHSGLRATELDLDPIKIRALILHTPFFGGVDRTESEHRLANNPSLPLSGTDLMWELALPKGADRDHEFSNPLKDGGSGLLNRVSELGWKVLLTGCSGDPLIDRQVELGKVMEEKGIGVVAKFSDGGYHGVEMMDPKFTLPFVELVKEFIFSSL